MKALIRWIKSSYDHRSSMRYTKSVTRKYCCQENGSCSRTFNFGVVRLDRSYSAPSHLKEKNWALIVRRNEDYYISQSTMKTNIPNVKITVYPVINSLLKYDDKGRCTNAFEVLSSPEVLWLAYEKIKSNPGNMVMGVDKKTLDGISFDWFEETSRSIIKESYSPKPDRRVYIPKPNGKLRPLGISSPRDKIVQQAIKLIFDIVLEPRFLDYSHGFRPNRGCHSALREIRRWGGVSWLIEGDIRQFFDSIDHHILANLLKEHFTETRLYSLYWKMVKAGYVEWDGSKRNYINALEGVPQGGIISPILSNLLLNELDKFVDNLSNTLEAESLGKKPYLPNPKYHALSMKIYRLKKKMKIELSNNKPTKDLKIKYIKLVKERRLVKSLIHNPLVTRIKYVRYADDWLIGVWGTRKKSEWIKSLISKFLGDLKLTLSQEKTLITNARSSRAKFLSVYLKRIASNSGPQKNYKSGGISKRIPAGGIWMTAAIPEIVQRLVDKEFLEWKNLKWKPKSVTKFLPLRPRDIVLRYKSILTGLLNYYSFVDNKPRLAKLHWILKESLRKTLCRKFNTSGSLLLKRLGPELEVVEKLSTGKISKVNFTCPDLKRTPMNFLGKNTVWDPLSAKDWKVSTHSSLGYPCSSCGSTTQIEMHHVKHIRTINLKLNTFDRMMAEINRKQVPLCRNCHMEVHRGKYSGKSLRYWKA